MFYFSQLYHLKRAFSRIDQLRSVVGTVTLGTLLASGMQEFLLQNTALETAYPRSLLFYVWFFSVIFTVLGREGASPAVDAACGGGGVARDNLLIVGDGPFAHDITNHICNRPELGYVIVGIVTAERKQGEMLGYPFNRRICRYPAPD